MKPRNYEEGIFPQPMSISSDSISSNSKESLERIEKLERESMQRLQKARLEEERLRTERLKREKLERERLKEYKNMKSEILKQERLEYERKWQDILLQERNVYSPNYSPRQKSYGSPRATRRVFGVPEDLSVSGSESGFVYPDFNNIRSPVRSPRQRSKVTYIRSHCFDPNVPHLLSNYDKHELYVENDIGHLTVYIGKYCYHWAEYSDRTSHYRISAKRYHL